MISALELAGTLAFALSGVALAIDKRLDVVGATTLAFVAGLAGGIIRDVLLGEFPPATLGSEWHLAVPIAAVALMLSARMRRLLPVPMLTFDAVGLGLFAVVGATKAGEAGLGVPAAIFIGVLSAVGGGVLRDVLVRDIPQVFTPDGGLYAIPAAGGAALVALAAAWGYQGIAIPVAVAAGVSIVRLLSLRLGWKTPRLG